MTITDYIIPVFTDHSVLYFASSATNKKHKKRKNTQNVHNDYDKLQINTACTLKLLKPITPKAKSSEKKLDTFHKQFKIQSFCNR